MTVPNALLLILFYYLSNFLCVCVCACMHGTAIIIIIFDCILAICIYSLELEMFALLKFSSLFAGPVLVDFNVRLIMLILFLQMQCYC